MVRKRGRRSRRIAHRGKSKSIYFFNDVLAELDRLPITRSDAVDRATRHWLKRLKEKKKI